MEASTLKPCLHVENRSGLKLKRCSFKRCFAKFSDVGLIILQTGLCSSWLLLWGSHANFCCSAALSDKGRTNPNICPRSLPLWAVRKPNEIASMASEARIYEKKMRAILLQFSHWNIILGNPMNKKDKQSKASFRKERWPVIVLADI